MVVIGGIDCRNICDVFDCGVMVVVVVWVIIELLDFSFVV